MKGSDCRKSVRDAFESLIDIELTRWDLRVGFGCTDLDQRFQRIALNPESTYSDVYKAGLQLRAYSFSLVDFSYFQFWTSGSRGSDRLRFAYYPNPYRGDVEDILTGDETTYDAEAYFQLLDEATFDPRIPPIRYDLAIPDYSPVEHPASHLTIGHHSANRWPVSFVLTPKAFVFLVCKRYYGDFWKRHICHEDPLDGYTNRLDRALADERSNCADLDLQHFAERERKQPHFT